MARKLRWLPGPIILFVWSTLLSVLYSWLPHHFSFSTKKRQILNQCETTVDLSVGHMISSKFRKSHPLITPLLQNDAKHFSSWILLIRLSSLVFVFFFDLVHFRTTFMTFTKLPLFLYDGMYNYFHWVFYSMRTNWKTALQILTGI